MGGLIEKWYFTGVILLPVDTFQQIFRRIIKQPIVANAPLLVTSTDHELQTP